MCSTIFPRTSPRKPTAATQLDPPAGPPQMLRNSHLEIRDSHRDSCRKIENPQPTRPAGTLCGYRFLSLEERQLRSYGAPALRLSDGFLAWRLRVRGGARRFHPGIRLLLHSKLSKLETVFLAGDSRTSPCRGNLRCAAGRAKSPSPSVRYTIERMSRAKERAVTDETLRGVCSVIEQLDEEGLLDKERSGTGDIGQAQASPDGQGCGRTGAGGDMPRLKIAGGQST